MKDIKINKSDHIKQVADAFKIIFQGIGSWKADRNRSMYPVNKKGFMISNISNGIKEIAEPINTVLIVIIIGVTLFLKNVDNMKHSDAIESITPVEIANAKKNLHIISPSDKNNNP